VFEITSSGTEAVVYAFTGGADGSTPYAGLVFDKLGNLYGTTPYGGTFNSGTVFKLSPSRIQTDSRKRILESLCSCRGACHFG